MTLRVAAAQLPSTPGDLVGNLTRAEALAERAAERRTQLVLFPELMPGGYAYEESQWAFAEPAHGATAQWLSRTSRRLGLWLATTFLEADGEDFFNTLVLTRPDGTEAGRCRKQTPAAYEAWFFKGEPSPHVIETELGRIGVAICMDNQLGWLPRLLHDQKIDLLLQPHAWSLPLAPWATMTRRVLERDHDVQRSVAPTYARALGVPALFANAVGPWTPSAPRGWPRPPPSHFPGHSTVADSDGTVRAQLDGAEGLAIADVSLDPSRKVTAAPRARKWTFPGPPLRGWVQMLAALGERSYRRNPRRKEMALAISRRGSSDRRGGAAEVAA